MNLTLARIRSQVLHQRIDGSVQSSQCYLSRSQNQIKSSLRREVPTSTNETNSISQGSEVDIVAQYSPTFRQTHPHPRMSSQLLSESNTKVQMNIIA
jgi:hypothetical protein